jgi:hypothetical protein
VAYSEEVLTLLNDIRQQLADCRRLMQETRAGMSEQSDPSNNALIVLLAILLNSAHKPQSTPHGR